MPIDSDIGVRVYDRRMTDDLSIGRLARASGASVRSLRHYEAKGLLQARRGPNGYRLFEPATVDQVQQIRRMLSLGFTLEEIATFPHCMLHLDSGLCPVAAAAHQRRLAEVEEQSRSLEAQRERLVQTLRASIQAVADDEVLKARQRSLHES